MLPKLRDNTLKNKPRMATLGIGAGVAAILVVGLGGPAMAAAGDNPPPGLLAKIQIATQAFNRTPTFMAGRTMPRSTVRPRLRARR